jgi:phosphate transport system substrate-binding protein
MGGVVPVVNIDGIKPGEMKLTGKVLADIYLGKIKKWNEPAISPTEQRPQTAGLRHHRGEPLGRLGHDVHLYQLPVQDQHGVEGQSLAMPPRSPGRRPPVPAAREMKASPLRAAPQALIGYVEYAFAKQNKLTYTLLQNREGQFVAPDDKSSQAAAPAPTGKTRPVSMKSSPTNRAKQAGPLPARPSY